MSFPLKACHAWIIFLCHPVIYSRDPVKNTNKISIFYYFLDTVVKPRYDTKHVFRSTQASLVR
ncbi:MAG TPA: palindromic element RPE4 domain-containing protein [Rickettsia endosymbiont of Degeeriella rufa]|nr:palindromic element RPE4 domain-containing protein [Rickettsia endosymbiont of Columbicola hoogstraali]HJD62293.1 palindromic element RPE4 domain-containing protein [Rickettsia endosymbiont of Degeeriella rufa]